MNDFTKEDLKKIYGCVDLFTEGADSREEHYQPLLNKIQSMIDNYVEHEVCKIIDEDNKILTEENIYFEGEIQCNHETDFISPSGIIQRCQGDIYNPFKCHKCGEYFNHE